MTETDEYILGCIRTWVWSGYYDPEEVDAMIDDVLEEGADEAMLRASVGAEFEKKAEAEKSWLRETDCDRLDRAFDHLESRGVLALQNAGMTMSDGHSDCAEAIDERGRDRFRGYCFFHGQDLERAVAGEGLFMAFDSLADDAAAKIEIGREVVQALAANGFEVDWNGDPEKRLFIAKINWQRRR